MLSDLGIKVKDKERGLSQVCGFFVLKWKREIKVETIGKSCVVICLTSQGLGLMKTAVN